MAQGKKIVGKKPSPFLNLVLMTYLKAGETIQKRMKTFQGAGEKRMTYQKAGEKMMTYQKAGEMSNMEHGPATWRSMTGCRQGKREMRKLQNRSN